VSEIALKLIREAKRTKAKSLDLGKCGLTTIPDEVFELTWLEELYLCNQGWNFEKDAWIRSANTGKRNVLDRIPKFIERLKKLRVLYCNGDYDVVWEIIDISNLSTLINLQTLDISSNQLTDISALSNLSNLSSLNLYSNQLKDISPLSNLSNLVSLDLHQNKLTDISPLSNLSNLSDLSLRSNQLTDISALSNLSNLSHLVLHQNNLVDVSPLSNLSYLLYLGLALNDLTDISPLSNLSKLSYLDIHANQISDIYPLSNLIDLEYLCLELNRISDISPLSNLINLNGLDLNVTEVSDISPLSNLINLKELNLDNNELLGISALSKLVNLNRLSLVGCNLTDISGLSNLLNLNKLDLSNNKISDISALAALISLNELKLTENKISNISPLSNLINLSKLDIGENNVSNIFALSNLLNLSELNLYSNKISDISYLSNLLILRELDLNFNNISDVYSLKNLIEKIGIEWSPTSKNTITIAGNPLKIPSPEIIKQGKEDVLKHLDRLEKEETSKIYEAKLLILGEGGVGKTTLYRKLQDVNATMPEEHETTKGIDIRQLPFKMENGEDFTINLWDFGGQEIYHATHQFFLSKRSLYVLVTDTRKEDTDFNYWLQVIELLGGDSPVIIIQNEKGGRKKQLDESSMQARFSNIKPVISLDLKNDINDIGKLYEKIKFYIQDLPHIGEEQPLSWINVRQKLEELSLNESFINVESYYKICKENDIDSRSETLSLSQYLHDLGVLLHFQDDAILRRMLILKKEWATDGVYAVLDDAHVTKKKGHFFRQDAEQIWGSGYQEKYEELLRLMMKFELCYKVPDVQPEQYIATQLLSVEKPKYEWQEDNNLVLQYRYKFMPKGLISRFIVRMQRYVTNRAEMWRTGVVLYRENTRAEVVELYGTNTIQIRIDGQHPKELMTVITEEFDRLNETFGGELRVDKLVPCNCRICRYSNQPNFYTYADLKRRKERSKRTVECMISYDDVNVLDLLDSVFITTRHAFQPKKLFISYSKHDAVHLEAFKKHLMPLSRDEKIITWSDKNLLPGEEWDKSIRHELESSDVIVLLISADFLATDYVMDVEVPRAVERHNSADAVVIPVIVRPCMWQYSSFALLNALPAKGKPITTWENQDDAWREVAEKIKFAVEKQLQ